MSIEQLQYTDLLGSLRIMGLWRPAFGLLAPFSLFSIAKTPLTTVYERMA